MCGHLTLLNILRRQRRRLATMMWNVSITAQENMRSPFGEAQLTMVPRWPSRCYVVVLVDFSCTCGKTKQYHSPCSHYIAAARHRGYDYESRLPLELSVDALVRTWSPRFEPYLDEGQWPPYTGRKYIADPGCRWNKRGSRKRSRYNMAMDQISGRTRRGRARPFVSEPEENNCGRCGRLGHNSRRYSWPLSQVLLLGG